MTTTTTPTDTIQVDIDRIFDATLERIWHMFTEPDEIAVCGCGDWYDHVHIDLDLRIGGIIHHRVTGKADGSAWTFHGVYHEVDEGNRLAYTFDWKADWREDPTPSMVTITFSPLADGRTAIHLEHAGMPAPGAESTRTHWNGFLDKLESLV
jgi:uncharacterized protein YndB with AHSA1/START domain